MKTFLVEFKKDNLPSQVIKATKVKVDQGMALFIDEGRDPKEIVAVVNCEAVTMILEQPV